MLKRASKAHSDTVMEEVAQHSASEDQIMRALSLTAVQNIINVTNKRSALNTHLELFTASGPPQDTAATKIDPS